PADLADRLGQVCEEVEVEGRGALVEQEAEDQQQWQHDEARRHRRGHAHERALRATRAGAQARPTSTAPPTDHTSSRASPFTATVSTKSSKPISISAARYRSD